MSGETPGSLQFRIPDSNNEIQHARMVWTALWYSLVRLLIFIAKLLQGSYVDGLDNQVHPTTQRLFLNESVFLIHTT
jgi:hypothetical protein